MRSRAAVIKEADKTLFIEQVDVQYPKTGDHIKHHNDALKQF